jgi:hypothetical protein
MKKATEWKEYCHYEYVEARAKHNNEKAWIIAWEKTIEAIRQKQREACAAAVDNLDGYHNAVDRAEVVQAILNAGKED